MSNKTYFNTEDLAKFGNVTEWQKEMGDKFFDWYGSVFKEGALTSREKSLIALAVAHALKCPYCIDAYTKSCITKGCEEEELMEATHVAAAIAGGSTLINGVQMMNRAEDLLM